MFCCKLRKLFSPGSLNYRNDRTMKERIEKCLIFIVLFTMILFAGCKKAKVPVVSTTPVTNVTESTATSGGNITDDGGAAVTARGVCWSISDAPSTTDSKTTDGSGSGYFSSNINGLSVETTYYIRAYAANSVGTGYGLTILFKTPVMSPGPPIAITLPAVPTITGTKLCGIVYANYLHTYVYFEFGINGSYGSQGLIYPPPEYAEGGNYTYFETWPVSGYTTGTVINYRVKAVNSEGTAYGDDMTFTSSSK